MLLSRWDCGSDAVSGLPAASCGATSPSGRPSSSWRSWSRRAKSGRSWRWWTAAKPRAAAWRSRSACGSLWADRTCRGAPSAGWWSTSRRWHETCVGHACPRHFVCYYFQCLCRMLHLIHVICNDFCVSQMMKDKIKDAREEEDVVRSTLPTRVFDLNPRRDAEAGFMAGRHLSSADGQLLVVRTVHWSHHWRFTRTECRWKPAKHRDGLVGRTRRSFLTSEKTTTMGSPRRVSSGIRPSPGAQQAVCPRWEAELTWWLKLISKSVDIPHITTALVSRTAPMH